MINLKNNNKTIKNPTPKLLVCLKENDNDVFGQRLRGKNIGINFRVNEGCWKTSLKFFDGFYA